MIIDSSLEEYVGVSRQGGGERALVRERSLCGSSGHRHVMCSGNPKCMAGPQQKQMVKNGKKEHCTGRKKFRSHGIKILLSY